MENLDHKGSMKRVILKSKDLFSNQEHVLSDEVFFVFRFLKKKKKKTQLQYKIFTDTYGKLAY